MREIDETILDISRCAIRQMLKELNLTAEEVQFVNENAVKVAENAISAFDSLPAETVSRMRPITIIAAIAFIVGPNDVWTRGISAILDVD